MPQTLHHGIKALIIATLCWLASLLLAAPSLLILANDDFETSRTGLFVKQVEDPFFRPENGAWHGGFLAFRILIPMVAHVLGIGPLGGVALIWIAGLLALCLVFAFLAARIGDRSAILVTLGLSMTVVIQGSHACVGLPDAVNHLLVMAMVFSPSWPVWFAGTLLGLFNDERLLVSLPLALALVHYRRRNSITELAKASLPQVAAVAAALALGWLLRHGIANGLIGGRPIKGPMLPEGVFLDYPIRFKLIGILLAFGLLWIIPAKALCASVTDDRTAWWYWVAVFLYALLGMVVCQYVTDYWRSLACLFPLILIGVLALHDMRPLFLAKWLPLLVVIMVVAPKFQQIARLVSWIRPLPISVWEYKTDRLFLDYFREHPVRHSTDSPVKK